MAKNVGTLISAAIRPIDSSDPIASAYASEIKGGFHTTADLAGRNSIIEERREWGMMCYVISDNKTYQLSYNYSSTNILDNTNWKEFNSGGSIGGSGEWIDSVLSVTFSQPLSPSNGDRYLVGRKTTDSISWGTYSSPGFVAEWNSSLSKWEVTFPSDGTSVRVDDEDNSIYRYEGSWDTGQWEKELLGQIRSVDVVSLNGSSYSVTIDPPIDFYQRDMIFITQFNTTNTGLTVSLNINSIGEVLLKKPSPNGLVNLVPNEIQPGFNYSLTYDGNYFQIVKPYEEGVFDIKYYIEPSDYVIVPQYYQYWVYGDLTISGYMENYGNVIIMNGGLVLTGGTFSNFGNLILTTVSLGLTPSFNNSNTIEFTQQNTVFGLSVSAAVVDGSLTQSKLNIMNPNDGATGYVLGYTASGEFVWLDTNSFVSSGGATAGSGLSISSSGLTLSLDVNTGLGLTISNSNNVEIQWGGTQSGLTFSGNSLSLNVDGSTIIINNSGQLESISTQASPVYQKKFSLATNGDYSPTGLTLSSLPSEYSRIQVFINGQVQILGDGTFSGVDCYFGDTISAKNLINLSIGDELYWNGTQSDFDLTAADLISLMYES